MHKKNRSLLNRFLYSQKIAPYVFILPFVLSFVFFFLYPIIKTVILSFQNIGGFGDSSAFVGFKNYQSLMNPHFFKAIGNNVIYTAVMLLIVIPIPIILAIFLNSKNLPGKKIFRSALFVPSLTSTIVAGIIFRLLFAENETAPVNAFLHLFGLPAVAWQRDSKYSMFLIIILSVWSVIGINVIYFLSGLQNIPEDLYEAADIDGAGYWAKLIFVTIPQLRSIMIYVLTVSVYGGFAMFTQSFIFWQTSSPEDSGLTIIGYLYQQGFQQGNLSVAYATGIIMVIIVFALNIIQLRFFGLFRKENL
jgi:ABC-type sugar transport systems, permease components